MKKIYLDVCSLCRPFDDQNYIRIRLETDAVNLILANVRSNVYQLMKSKVHIVEKKISDKYEQLELIGLLKKYGKTPLVNTAEVKSRANELINLKFGIADAVLLAYSEIFKSDFISCDDKLIKKCENMIIP
jgi:predicted nucleic acid-binding protein